MVISEVHFLLNQIKKNDLIFTHLMACCLHVSIEKICDYLLELFASETKTKQKGTYQSEET